MHAKCPGCGAPLNYDSRFFGRQFKCATCMQMIEITRQGSPRLVAVGGQPVATCPAPARPSGPPIKYTCKHCNAVLETDASMGWQEEPCPMCRGVNRVPPSKEQKRQEKERERAAQRQEREERRREEAERLAEIERHAEVDRLRREQEAAAVPSAVAVPASPPSVPAVADLPAGVPRTDPVAHVSPVLRPPPGGYPLSPMAFVGNLLWFIFGGGALLGLYWLALGLLMVCTVIGAPFGMAAFRIAGFAAFPFGRQLVDARLLGENRIPGTALANLLWVILAGLWLAIGHALAGIGCLFGFWLVFPVFWAIAHFHLAAASFAPLGKRAVPKAYAQALLQAAAQGQLPRAPAPALPAARRSGGGAPAHPDGAGPTGPLVVNRCLIAAAIGLGVLVLVASVTVAIVYLGQNASSQRPAERGLGTPAHGPDDALLARARDLWNAKEYSKAVVLMQDAANHGHANGQWCMGYAFYSGQGVARDYRAAIRWWEKSAAQGYAHAQNSLAWVYATCPDPSYHDADKAIAFAQEAIRQQPTRPHFVGTLSAAYARHGRFDVAIETITKAMALVRDDKSLSPDLQEKLSAAQKLMLISYSRREAYTEGEGPADTQAKRLGSAGRRSPNGGGGVDKAWRDVRNAPGETAPRDLSHPSLQPARAPRTYASRQEGDEHKPRLAPAHRADERTGFVTAGDAAFAEADWPTALVQYQKALAMVADDLLAAKVTECEFRIALAKADKLRQARKYDEAARDYRAAASIKPSAKALTDARLAELASDRKYDELVSQAKAAMKASQWSVARKAAQEAQKIRVTSEINGLIAEIRYQENVDLGREAMGQGDLRAALNYFRLAKGSKDCQEVEVLIRQVDAKLKSAGG